jgi:hypothetical protein
MDPDPMLEVSDYWRDLENSPNLSSSSSIQHNNSSRDLEHSLDIQLLKNQIKDIRKVNKVVEFQVVNKEKQETKHNIKSAIQEVKSKFDANASLARQNHSKMKQEVEEKTTELSYISQYLIDSEVLAAQNRAAKSYHVKQSSPENPQEKKALIKKHEKELYMVKLQIQAMKDGIKEYKYTTENTNNKISELIETLYNSKINNQKEAKEAELEGNNKIIELNIEKDKLKADFEVYKFNKSKELYDIENKCRYNKQYIELLQNELKNAKKVIQNPVLQLRVFDKLQEYVDHYDGNKPFINNSKAGNGYFCRPQASTSKPVTKKEILAKESEESFSPLVSKVNFFHKGEFSTKNGARISKSIQIFNNSQRVL